VFSPAIVEFELAWAHLLSTTDYTYRELDGEAIYRFKSLRWRRRGTAVPSDFFHHNVVLSFRTDAIGIRLRDLSASTIMMWGSDYPHSQSTFPRSRKILDGVPDDEQAKSSPLTAIRRSPAATAPPCAIWTWRASS
jgi:hypothetical protein